MRLSLLVAATCLSTALAGPVINIKITANRQGVHYTTNRERDTEEQPYQMIHRRAGAEGDRQHGTSTGTTALVARGPESDRVEELMGHKRMIADAIQHMQRHIADSKDLQERQEIEAVLAQYEARSVEIDTEIAGPVGRPIV